MKAEEWLEGYERRDATTNGEDLAADIIRALLVENDQLKADRALENDLGLPAGVLTLKRDYEQLRVENAELKQMVGKCTLSTCQHHKDEMLRLEQDNAELLARVTSWQNKYSDAKGECDCRTLDCERYKEQNAELRALITELKAVEDLYDTAETGPEYNYAYQRWQDAVKALFAKVCNGRP